MKKNRRCLISAAVLVACVGIALGVLAMLPPSHPCVMKMNFDRIEDGMTQAEVEATLGDPHQLFGPGGGPVTWGHWRHADGSSITINFGDTKVVRKHFHESSGTFTAKLRRWLHLAE